MHLSTAATRRSIDCTYGLPDFEAFGAAGFGPAGEHREGTQSFREFVDNTRQGNCCIGTPDDAIAHIEAPCCTGRVGFGTLLGRSATTAPPPATFTL